MYAYIYNLDKKDYVFRSFWDREDCYRILSAFLIKFKGGVPPSSSSATPFSSSSSDTNKHLSKAVNSAARPRSTSTEDADHVFDTGILYINHMLQLKHLI